MNQLIQRPKGTADLSPRQSYVWHYVEALARETARRFGFFETRFPAFEATELFVRGVGDTSDIVQKEMYTFLDKGNRSMTLRPEGTASTVRAYLENGEAQHGAPYKVYYIAPNFRYEKPQAGRLRQHHQFGIECFGAAGAEADAEVIALGHALLSALRIDSELRINSIGCPTCRPDYQKALHAYFSERREQLCPTCHERLDKNPMRILDCKSPVCSELAEGAPRSLDCLCGDCQTHLDTLRACLDSIGLPYVLDSGIVRGLDYYTRTVFEFISPALGNKTVCGGGRYDGLIAELGGVETPAVGFGCGLERLIFAAEQSGFVFPVPEGCALYLAGADDAGRAAAFTLAAQLRAQGVSVQIDLCARGLKAQMKHANRIGARFTAVLGGSEIEAGTGQLKQMDDGTTTAVTLEAGAIAQHLMGNL